MESSINKCPQCNFEVLVYENGLFTCPQCGCVVEPPESEAEPANERGISVNSYLSSIPFFSSNEILRIFIKAFNSLKTPEDKQSAIFCLLRSNPNIYGAVLKDANATDSVVFDEAIAEHAATLDEAMAEHDEAIYHLNTIVKTLEKQRVEQDDDISKLLGAFESYVVLSRKYGVIPNC